MGELEVITEKEAVKRLNFVEDMAREGKHFALNMLFSEAMESLHAGICTSRSIQKAVIEGFYDNSCYENFIENTNLCLLESSKWYWGSFLMHNKSRKSMYDVMLRMENIERYVRRFLNSGRTNKYLVEFNNFVRERKRCLESIFIKDEGYLMYKMKKAADRQDYELAAQFRDNIRSLDKP